MAVDRSPPDRWYDSRTGEWKPRDPSMYYQKVSQVLDNERLKNYRRLTHECASNNKISTDISS